MAAQSFRTEAFYKGFTDQPARQDFGQTFEHLWQCAFVVADNIARRHWALMVIVSDDVFYLGDNPVVLQRTGNPKDGNNLGFDVKGVEAFLPLSPKCALYMPCRSVSDERIAQYKNAVMLHRAVRSAVMRGYHGGAAELQAAQTTILRTHSLYEAFTKGVPLVAAEPQGALCPLFLSPGLYLRATCVSREPKVSRRAAYVRSANGHYTGARPLVTFGAFPEGMPEKRSEARCPRAELPIRTRAPWVPGNAVFAPTICHPCGASPALTSPPRDDLRRLEPPNRRARPTDIEVRFADLMVGGCHV